MSHDEFEKIVNNRLSTCKSIMTVKNKEYAAPTDKLHNFRKAARMKGRTMLEICDDYNGKHLTSFDDMIETVKRGEVVSVKALDEKITDIINYFLIAEAIIIEHNRKVVGNEKVGDSKANYIDNFTKKGQAA